MEGAAVEPRLPALVPGALAAVAVGGLAAADGGYFPPSWGWAGVGLSGAALAALLLRPRVALGRLGLAFLLLLAALTAWTALSALWSLSPPLSVLDAQRLLVYVAAAAAFLLAGSRASAGPLLAGVLVGVVAIGAANLVLRQDAAVEAMGAPAEPVGYENGLALLLVVGILLGAGLALAATARAARLGAAAAAAFLVVPLVPLSSRGAWLALAAGVVAAATLRLVRRPVAVPLVLAGALAAAIGAGAAASAERSAYWRVATEQAASAPVLGTGAGTFARVWTEERRVPLQAVDAHNLYLETLAELGPLGLVLLAAALAVPVAAALAARARPLAPVAFGAYAAFLVHAAADWDWELAAVGVVATAVGSAALLLARGDTAVLALAPRRRVAAARAVLLVGLAALVGLVGNTALTRARAAAVDGRWGDAASLARRATRLAPWSAEAWRVLGDARLALGRPEAGREALRRAVERDPSDPELWLALADALEGEARARALDEALRRNPLGVPPS